MILFFDTETSGFVDTKLDHNHPKQCRVMQLGAMLVDDQHEDRPEVMRLDVLIDIGEEAIISEGAINVHGITRDKMLQLGVNENAALDIFFDMVDRADLICAHNTAFDTKVLRLQAQRLSGDPRYDPFASTPSYCTMESLTPIMKLPNKNGKPGFAWPKLEVAVRTLLGREPTNAHNAIGDVIDCRDCFFYIQDLKAQLNAAEAGE